MTNFVKVRGCKIATLFVVWKNVLPAPALIAYSINPELMEAFRTSNFEILIIGDIFQLKGLTDGIPKSL